MHPRMTVGLKFMCHGLAVAEPGKPQVGVLVDAQAAIAPCLAGHKIQHAGRGAGIRLLPIGGLGPGLVGLYPDLQEVHRVLLGRVVFTVYHPSARRHVLEFARLDHASGAHRVPMLQRALQHVADDLHVAMRVFAEAGALGDGVIVYDAQAAEAHPIRVVVIGEGECVVAVQPAVVGVASFICFTYVHHIALTCTRL